MLSQGNLKFKRTGSAKESLYIGGIILEPKWEERKKQLKNDIYKLSEEHHQQWRNEIRDLFDYKTVTSNMVRLAREDFKNNIYTDEVHGLFTINITKATPMTHISNVIKPEPRALHPRIILSADDGFSYAVQPKEKIHIK